MKKIIFSFLLLFSLSVFSQNTSQYKKVYDYNQYHENWALVKTIGNTFGFIDRKGNVVVQAIYDKIYKFELKNDNKRYAMVENVSGAYGFIDENGKVVIEAIHWKKEEAIQKLDILIKKHLN